MAQNFKSLYGMGQCFRHIQNPNLDWNQSPQDSWIAPTTTYTLLSSIIIYVIYKACRREEMARQTSDLNLVNCRHLFSENEC